MYNIIEILADPANDHFWADEINMKLRDALRDFALYCKKTGTQFFMSVEGGAGAPVQGIMDKWKQAGLAGCTGGLVVAQPLRKPNQNFVSVNTMKPQEQFDANPGLREKDIMLEQDTEMGKLQLILNDPNRILEKLLGLEVVEVAARLAYRPIALVFTSSGGFYKSVKNQSTAIPRDSTDYFMDIDKALEEARKQEQSLSASSVSSAPDWGRNNAAAPTTTPVAAALPPTANPFTTTPNKK